MQARSAAGVFLVLILHAVGGSMGRAEEFAWAGRVGGAQRDVSTGVAMDAAGSVYFVGFFQDGVDFDPGPGSYVLTSAGSDDAFVVKLDRGGGFVWARSLGGAGFDQAQGIAVDSDGNVWIVGFFQETVDFDPGPGIFPLTAGWRDAFIWKLDGNGNLIWAGHVGGTSTDTGRAVAFGGFGMVYVVGTFIQTADFDPGPAVFNLTSAGNEDTFVLKLDGEGHFVWARRLGGPSEDSPYGMAIDGDERIWTVGRFSGTADFDPGSGRYELTASGLYDGFVSELDRSGTFAWAGQVGGTGTDRFDGVAWDRALGVYAVGTFQGTADLDPGTKTDERTSAGGYDVFATALQPTGDVIWTRTLGGTQDDHAYGIAADAAGYPVAVGKFQGTVDFDPGEGTFALTAVSYDAFAWKLDAGGDLRWAGQFGGAGDDGARAVVTDNGGGLAVSGDFSYTADFDPGPGVFSLTPAGSYDAFVVRLVACGAFEDRSRYGRLIFAPRCTADASGLPGIPGTPYAYDHTTVVFRRRPADRVFLSSAGNDFAPLVVDDALHADGVDSGLGPYGFQPGVPPFLYDVPIERNLVPEAPLLVNDIVPPGTSELLFEAVDLDRWVRGLTPVYLVVDCGLVLDGRAPTRLRFVCHDDTVLGMPTDFDVRGGALSELRSDGSFERASCIARSLSNPAEDPLPDPPPGDGRYYLARALAGGNACSALGYGDSEGVEPDPRDALDALPACP